MFSEAHAHWPHITRPTAAGLVGLVVAAVALAGSLAMLAHGIGFGGDSASKDLDWVGALLAACATLPLVAWGRFPRAVFAATASASVLLGGLDYPTGVPLGSTAALYLFAASRTEAEAWTRRDTALVVALFATYLGATAQASHGFPGSDLLHTGLAWAVAWFAGERTRLVHQHVAELRDRALRAERDGERDRLLAAAEERARIARDLHDAAGHSINVIALRAGTARLRQDPERSQVALEDIEELARKTVAEIDQIVGTLRESDAASDDVDAPPRLASLRTLVAGHTAAGLDVSISTEGEARPLDSTVDQAAYRILQEALTNAARHGTGAARIQLGYGEHALDLIVANPAPVEAVVRSNGGHGLVGMRERATLLGGSLDTERSEASFCVRARLPYAGPSS